MHRRAPRSSRGPVIATTRSHLFTCYYYMFINIPCRTSDCVERMVVDPLRAVVQVAYRKGSIYEYTHVSRRAILNLLLNPNMSLGFWVNDNLLPFNSKTRCIGSCALLNALHASDLPITDDEPKAWVYC